MGKFESTITIKGDEEQMEFFHSMFDELKKNNALMLEFMQEMKKLNYNMEDDGK